MSETIVMLLDSEDHVQRIRTIIEDVITLLDSKYSVASHLLLPVRIREHGIFGQIAIDWRSFTMTITNELLQSEDAVNVIANLVWLKMEKRKLTS